MRVLSLDLSTSTGWALFDHTKGKEPKLVEHGTLCSDSNTESYPTSYIYLVDSVVNKLVDLVVNYNPDVIPVEEVNMARARISQKKLDAIHYGLLRRLMDEGYLHRIKYINTSEWRKVTGVTLGKDERTRNKKLSQAKSQAKRAGKALDKKKLGIAGKFTLKHKAVAVCNELYDLKLTATQDDTADAILLGVAYCRGASIYDGK